jgi:hypothetical protein
VASAKRQLELDLLARDKTGAATKSAADNLEDVGDAADGAARSTDKLSTAADKAGDEAQDLGREARQAAAGVEKLDREIESVERELKKMALAFAEAQTKAERLDITKAIRRTQGDLRSLTKNRGLIGALLPSPGEVASAGAGVGKDFGKSIKTALEAAGPQVKGALIGAAVLATPFIGAVISGAVISGVSAGVVAGGIALAARDPRVASAGKELGSRLLGNLEDDAEVFIGPVLKSVDMIGDRFDKLRPRFKRIFANASEFVEPLTEGLLDGVEGLTEGIDVLVAQGRPAIEALADTFAELGDASGDALAIISGGSEEAASGLAVFGAIAGSSIRGTAMLMRGLTEGWGSGVDKINLLRAAWADMTGDMDVANTETQNATVATASLNQNLELMAMKAAGASGPIVTLSDQINDMAEAGRDAFDVATNVGAALDKVTEAAAKNGATLSASTEKGRENRQALSGLRDALIAEYNAIVAVNGAGEEANSVARRSRDRFIAAARAFGASADEANRLADEMGLIKAPPPINIKDNFLAAQKRAREIRAELNRIDRTIPVRVIVSRQGDITYGSGGGRQAPMRAHGGPVTANRPYIVGDGGRPEVFVPESSGRIVPSVEQYARTASAGGGGMAAVTVAPSGALDEFERLIVKMLRTRPAFAAAVARYAN